MIRCSLMFSPSVSKSRLFCFRAVTVLTYVYLPTHSAFHSSFFHGLFTYGPLYCDLVYVHARGKGGIFVKVQ